MHFSPLSIFYITCIAASCRGSDANTTAAVADNDDDDDASQCDVIATHPEHLLLSSMDSCPATRFLLYFITIIVILVSMVIQCCTPRIFSQSVHPSRASDFLDRKAVETSNLVET